MKKIQKQNTQVCKKYRERYKKSNPNKKGICPDGLLNRGVIKYENGCWKRKSGNEEVLWINAKIRPLFLCKDPNETEPWDMRKETGRKNGSGKPQIANSFYKNIMRWLYGINHIANGAYPQFEDLKDDVILNYYDESPIMRINVKKGLGKGCVGQAKIKEACDMYGDLLKEQILLHKPNIIFCCNGTDAKKNPMMNLLKEVYKDLRGMPSPYKKGEIWLYYNDEVLIVHTYHPSAPISHIDMYNDMMHEIIFFIQYHHDIYKKITTPAKTV